MSVPSRSEGMRRVRAKRSGFARDVVLPMQSVIHNEVVSGATLLIAAVAALVWANSPWSDAYHELQHLPISFQISGVEIKESLLHGINDGLMALFFFVVGLEIKREFLGGELAHWKKAAFPVMAAAGGMILPASIYAALNAGGEGLQGWGIPMATDIAFALGVLALLGKRIPSQLRMLLLALAIVDDIGAILVIAIFYSEQLSWLALGAAVVLFSVIVVLLRYGFRGTFAYMTMALLFWLAVYQSGVHATIAGVLLGVVTPFRRWFSTSRYSTLASAHLQCLNQALKDEDHEEVQRMLGRMEELTRETESPLDRWERVVHPWVSFLVLPLFALINAGVTFSTDMIEQAMTSWVTLGVIAGLLVGKTSGILAFAWGAVKLNLAALPEGVTWKHIVGVGILAGIGFTVALFITDLAFRGGDMAEQAKVGILAASAVAGVVGYLTLYLVKNGNEER